MQLKKASLKTENKKKGVDDRRNAKTLNERKHRTAMEKYMKCSTEKYIKCATKQRKNG